MNAPRPLSSHAPRPIRTVRRRAVDVAVFAGVAALLAACQTPPPAAPPPPPPPPVVEAPAPPPPAAPPVAPPPAGPAAQQQAQKAALAAAELLEAGDEDAARAEIKRALGLDPQNKIALNFVRQLNGDPVALLGSESFNYTVRPGETLSRIAERFLQGDRYAFVILARYNGIAVPKQVGAGQVLKIPGKARPGVAVAAAAPAPVVETPRPAAAVARPATPAPAVPSAPAPAPAPPPPPEPTPAEKAMRNAQGAERNGDLATARIDYISAAQLGQPGATAKADQLGRTLVQRHTVAARSALARQDLDGSIANWQRVLDIEPGNATARSEIERMKALKGKLSGLK